MCVIVFGEEAHVAFDGLIVAYEKRVFNLIYRLIGDYDEAADLTQDTFVAAYRAYNDFRHECPVYTWLCRIAVNRCKNCFRERARQRGVEGVQLDDIEQDAGFSYDSASAAPDDALQRKELRQRIEEAIAELPEEYRIVAVLRDLQGMSYQDIADSADLSLDNVKVRLSRARAMLRRKLEPYFEDQGV